MAAPPGIVLCKFFRVLCSQKLKEVLWTLKTYNSIKNAPNTDRKRGLRRWEGINLEFEISRYKLLYIK